MINVLREMGSGGAMVTASGMYTWKAKGNVLIKRVSISISNLALQKAMKNFQLEIIWNILNSSDHL